MATAELTSASERAVVARVRTRLPKLEPGCRAIGVRWTDAARWQGGRDADIDGKQVRFADCPSVLAVLDALADTAATDLTVVLTALPDSELGDAVLARLHRGRLFEADRYTQLSDVLGARALDPRIRGEAWLVDALITLAEDGKIPPTAGATLGKARAIALVASARLGIDPDLADLPRLVAAFDDTLVRSQWWQLPEAERKGLVAHLGDRHGAGVGVVAALADRYDDVLALLLVAHTITSAPESDTRASSAFGGFQHVRFSTPRPSRDDVAAAAAAGIAYARDAPAARLNQQLRVAEPMLDELTALDLAAYSPVLPRGFVERLAAAAETLEPSAFEALEQHLQADDSTYRIKPVRAAARLHRWLESSVLTDYATATDGIAHHAREIAWVDRALTQVRAGDGEPRVAAVLQRVARDAGARRAGLDALFAARLASMDSTPSKALAVETFLPRVVAPLAAKSRVLLVVVDGMSGAVAGDLAERITDRRAGWTEIVRANDDGRESIVAALPTETRYSRTSLLCAELRDGNQAVERSVFPKHSFWPTGGAVLIHKSGVAGRDGNDLGADLESAVGPDGPNVVAVVLNAVDDSLSKGRQSIDPAWRPEDVTGLVPLLDRAVSAGRIVLLTSDHGHVLEHGAEYRHQPGGGARWRPSTGAPTAGEVVAAGPRMLAPEGRAIFAATEEIRYGAEAHGYHGGATLAEAAIPLIALLPPGMPMPAGWTEHTMGPPRWWDGTARAVAVPAMPPAPPKKRSTKKPAAALGDGLFEITPDASRTTRGAKLTASAAFKETHSEFPANRVPDPAVFQTLVDALIKAGGRLPLGDVVTVVGAAGRNPRGLVTAMRRVLNRDSYPVLELVDGGRAVELNGTLLDEQFPPDESAR